MKDGKQFQVPGETPKAERTKEAVVTVLTAATLLSAGFVLCAVVVRIGFWIWP